MGGYFEEGELNDPHQCVLRELYEETKPQDVLGVFKSVS
ncbi:MAG: hypothetical protein GX994_00900 [Firmicutes bacterium]|nr:hypothetical protein [Bacillota bacterium]